MARVDITGMTGRLDEAALHAGLAGAEGECDINAALIERNPRSAAQGAPGALRVFGCPAARHGRRINVESDRCEPLRP